MRASDQIRSVSDRIRAISESSGGEPMYRAREFWEEVGREMESESDYHDFALTGLTPKSGQTTAGFSCTGPDGPEEWTVMLVHDGGSGTAGKPAWWIHFGDEKPIKYRVEVLGAKQMADTLIDARYNPPA